MCNLSGYMRNMRGCAIWGCVGSVGCEKLSFVTCLYVQHVKCHFLCRQFVVFDNKPWNYFWCDQSAAALHINPSLLVHCVHACFFAWGIGGLGREHGTEEESEWTHWVAKSKVES